MAEWRRAGASGGVAGRAFGASYLLQHAEYRRGGSGAFERATCARADVSVKFGDRTIAANLVTERAEGDGRTKWSAALRTSTNIGRWLASHLLEVRQFETPDRSSCTATGVIGANGVVRGWGARAGFGVRAGIALAPPATSM